MWRLRALVLKSVAGTVEIVSEYTMLRRQGRAWCLALELGSFIRLRVCIYKISFSFWYRCCKLLLQGS